MLGLRVIGIRRTGERQDEVDEMYRPRDLSDLLPRAELESGRIDAVADVFEEHPLENVVDPAEQYRGDQYRSDQYYGLPIRAVIAAPRPRRRPGTAEYSSSASIRTWAAGDNVRRDSVMMLSSRCSPTSASGTKQTDG